jgi:hypothetical protein
MDSVYESSITRMVHLYYPPPPSISTDQEKVLKVLAKKCAKTSYDGRSRYNTQIRVPIAGRQRRSDP